MALTAALEELDHLGFFGLTQNPFPVAPDEQHFYISKHIDLVLTEIIHGIVSRKGFIVLTGDVGLGKTTMCRKILAVLEQKQIETSLVFHTAYQDVELLREINRDFGIEIDSASVGDQMRRLSDFLVEQNKHDRNCCIIIDDAQNLNHDSLEMIRMISNLEAGDRKLVQILLIGQPELMEKLNLPELRQLKSRIIIRKEPIPLTVEEVKNYITFKLNAAGNQGLTSMSKDAYKKLHRLTHGNFRQINILMDRALYVAFLHGTTEITKSEIIAAYQDLFKGYPKPLTKKIWPVLSMAVTGVALLVYFGTGALFQSKPGINTAAIIPGPNTTSKTGLNQDLQHETTLNKNEESDIGKASDVHSQSVPRALAEFLNAYGLTVFGHDLYQALKNDGLNHFNDTIYEKTGYCLIRLEFLPDSVKSRFGVLAYAMAPDTKEDFFLFWRPNIRIDKFYYGYKGDEILTIQKLLTKIGLYRSGMDGVVGRNLLKAMVDFQRQMVLPLTGYPDDKTLFLLFQQAEQV